MTARAGFSLVEVLVATFVFAVIAAVSVGLLTSSLNAREVNETRIGALAEVDTLRTLLRDDAGQVVLRPVRQADGRVSPVTFAGSIDGVPGAEAERGETVILSLTRRGWANPGGAQARSSLQRVDYVLTGSRLDRRVTTYPDASPATPVSSRAVIGESEGISIDFLYGTQWMPRAEARPGEVNPVMPTALRLRYVHPALGPLEHIVRLPEEAA